MNSFKTPKGTELPIMNIKGKPYLQTAYRIVWFREECPKHSIETDFIIHTDSSALVKAIIKDEQGKVLSTGHKYEDKQGFPDFREKAETGAIGRALAMIGFGTQFCSDELDEGTRLADAPLNTGKGVHPDQPSLEDGSFEESGYRINFGGKFNRKSLEELYIDPKVGRDGINSYIDYFHKVSVQKNKPLTPEIVEFIKEAEKFLGAIENKPLYPDEPWLSSKS